MKEKKHMKCATKALWTWLQQVCINYKSFLTIAIDAKMLTVGELLVILYTPKYC